MDNQKWLDYQDYINNSTIWDAKRSACLKRYNYQCGFCGDNQSVLQVHHTQSAKLFPLGNEPIITLKTLCQKCHSRYHLLGRLLS